MDQQLLDEFGLVHYIVKVRLGGYSGVRQAFADCTCDPPAKTSITEWKRTDSLPAWTILRLCKAADVDPIEVLKRLEQKELRARAPQGVAINPPTEMDWVPQPLTDLSTEGIYKSLVPDTRGAAVELAGLFEDVSLPYHVVAGWKARNSIPAWALLRVCRWAGADPLQILQYIEDKEVEARAKRR